MEVGVTRSTASSGVISFSAAQRCWVFDLPRAHAAAITDNVVELLVERLLDDRHALAMAERTLQAMASGDRVMSARQAQP